MWPTLISLLCACGAEAPGPADATIGPSPDTGTPTPETGTTVITDTASSRSDTGASPTLAWVSISAGAQSTCGVLSDGRLICFGSPYGGIVAQSPNKGAWTAVGVGSSNACALDSAGVPYCWGCEENDYLGHCFPPAEAFTRLEVGPFLGCGERADGTVVCWGAVPLPGRPQTAEMGGPFRDFAVSDSAICTLDLITGQPTCLDGNELPNGMVEPPAGLDLGVVASGANHACGLSLGTGVGVCWGSDVLGQAYPQPPAGAFDAIESTFSVTCMLAAGGEITCFDPLYPSSPSSPPPGLYTLLTVGYAHGCAVDLPTGEMVCWGGQGLGETEPPSLAELALP